MLKKIVKYSAKWCQPCKVYAKTFKKVSEMEKYKDITFEDVDIEEDEELESEIERLGIRSVPTTIFFDENGEQLYKVSGRVPEDTLMSLADKCMEENNG